MDFYFFYNLSIYFIFSSQIGHSKTKFIYEYFSDIKTHGYNLRRGGSVGRRAAVFFFPVTGVQRAPASHTVVIIAPRPSDAEHLSIPPPPLNVIICHIIAVRIHILSRSNKYLSIINERLQRSSQHNNSRGPY